MKKNFLSEPTISKQKKYFKWYAVLPEIFFIAILVIFFIWGIIDTAVIDRSSYSIGTGRWYKEYGVFELDSAFLSWFIWMVIGVVVAVCEFLVGKILFSQKILTVLYLEQLNENNRPKDNSSETKAE